MLTTLAVLLAGQAAVATAAKASSATPGHILIVGSINVDITVQLDRLPMRSETKAALKPSPTLAVGGKGANQAAAASLLAGPGAPAPRFVCRLGDDAHLAWLRAELAKVGVDTSASEVVPHMTTGQGIVWLDAEGAATSVVLGGANTEGWPSDAPQLRALAGSLVQGASALMLQREVPERVNEAFAEAARAAGILVLLDAGGSGAPISPALLAAVDAVCPNEQELQVLTGLPTSTEEEVVAAAQALLDQGARGVLVTLEARGSLLLQGAAPAGGHIPGASRVVRQPALPVPGGVVRDATAAGDAFRAAFATALVEGGSVEDAMRLAAAAGAIAVSRMGAMPSLPTREEVAELLQEVGHALPAASTTTGSCAPDDAALEQQPAAGAAGSKAATGSTSAAGAADNEGGFPLLFGARLNSMRARSDLAQQGSDSKSGQGGVLGWVARQGLVQGLGVVYFNYPEHLEGLTLAQVTESLEAAGLKAGGIAMRFPLPRFRAGALSNPDPELRAAAVELGTRGCQWASDLGASQLVVWSATDGYDYHLAANYTTVWAHSVAGLRALTDACRALGVHVALEWKPTDPASRFSFVPNTAAALLLARDVDRSSFGLVLDTGHLLMGGENMAASVAMVMDAGKLAGLHLNDGHTRLGAEDGLVFGSVHAAGAQELVYWLRARGYRGHVYFDTFPLNEDPVQEAELNIQAFKSMWAKAGRLEQAGIERCMTSHDALCALRLMQAV
uniref:Ribokinase n=1 Tax=Chlamydomonas leiostraca TaxID=1034604 RepID=A0A7S0WT08_9CHLO|mmetsp:Transcript_27068/g.68804  ORF Transcript_27068/g.68804 Transcript_27068/m.68804 type:complete len:733 (+) Transcript_27068:77-2275(+)